VEDRELEAGELECLLAEAETPLHQLCGHLTPLWVPVDSYRLKQEQLLAAAHQQKEQQQKEQQEKEHAPVFLQVIFLSSDCRSMIYIPLPFFQCCGSMTFWGGFGSGFGSGSGSWIRILQFSSLAFKMPAKNYQGNFLTQFCLFITF
jgi:hypothetical protein